MAVDMLKMMASRTTQRATEDLPRFLDRLVHDLREPLRSIHSFTELLSELAQGTVGPEGEHAFFEILSGTARMRMLIDAMADYSTTLQLEQTRASASLQLAFDMTTLTLDREIQDVGAIVTGTELPQAKIGLDRISRVFHKLIGNSLRFRGEAPPMISVTAVNASPDETCGDEDGAWLVRVADNGIGVQPEYCEAIFEPFMRVHGRRYGGAGMGLTISKNIVEHHGGRIWMEPRAEGGALCCFTVPAAA